MNTLLKPNSLFLFINVISIILLLFLPISFEAEVIITLYAIAIQTLANTKNKFLDYVLFISIIIISVCLLIHTIPGFSNVLLYDAIRLSPTSSNYTLWINFDKPWLLLLGIYYYKYSHVYNKTEIKNAVCRALLITLLALIALLAPGFAFNYLAFDPKIPHILPHWIILNLITVASEEVLWRGFLQTYLINKFAQTKYKNYIGLIVSSLFFAILHYQGGYIYVLLSFIAGLLYGTALLSTGRISSSIAVHFLVNLTHILFFTYPSLKVGNVF